MRKRVGSMPVVQFALACFAMAFAMSAAPADADRVVTFNIPAQSLASALQAFGVQASRQILVAPKLAAGKKGRSVVGEFPVDVALARLLEGSGLTFKNSQGTLLIVETATEGAAPARSDGATDPPSVSAGQAPAAADAIIVTGTRETSRTVGTSLAPIDIISAADLQKSGSESVRDLIAASTPSANVSSSGAGASFTIKTLSLRGLSSDQTLVLVNGKRRHDTSILFINGTTQNGQSPADLDLIPTSAIDHIEVLRDGASVQYGSDALAGVVNIILKKNEGGGASLTGGATAAGDGVRGDALIDHGWSIGNGGALHLSVDVNDQGRTTRGGPYTGRLYPLIDGASDPREATADRDINKPGQPKVVRYDAAYDLTLPLNDWMQLYSFTTAAYRDSNSWLTYRNPASVSNVLAVYPDGYIPRLDLQDVDYQAAFGVKGTAFWEIHWDLSTTYGEDQVNYRESSALNLSYGAASPTNFYIGATDFREWTTNLDLNRSFDIGLAAPLFAAVGTEYRENNYKILPGDMASYANGGVGVVSGSQGVTGFPPALSGAWSRNNKSGYVDLDQTIARRLDLSAAARYEDYSDFGNTTNEKGSFRFEPIDNYAIRGTVSTGFRAPTLAQEHYASSSTIAVTVPGFTSVIPYPVQTLPPDSPAARALGAAPLRPEKSRNYSVGVIAEPLPNLNLSVDAYEIRIKDRILLSATLLGGPVSTALAAAGLNPQQGGFFFTNAADTTTKGLDLVTSYLSRFDGFGTVRWGFDANFNHTRFDRIESPPPALAAAGLTLIDRQRQGDFTLGTPSNKLIFDLDWTRGDIETFLRATRYGPVTAVNDNPVLDAKAGSKLIVDFNVSYHITDHFNSTIGADNAFNVHPTIVPVADQANGAQYYNAYSPFGISGGFYYARLGYKF